MAARSGGAGESARCGSRIAQKAETKKANQKRLSRKHEATKTRAKCHQGSYDVAHASTRREKAKKTPSEEDITRKQEEGGMHDDRRCCCVAASHCDAPRAGGADGSDEPTATEAASQALREGRWRSDK
mmetsp:Transcript_23616/g.73158  ORF Transcript_23616/g.73158 Transcript_23616/m.73158 type:complete len:128 (-) Transcript_23616:209-592(-)